MTDVLDVLAELGYTEIRHDDHDDWTPLDDDHHHDDHHHDYGTTADTHVLLHDDRPRVELVDPDTGEELARARTPTNESEPT